MNNDLKIKDDIVVSLDYVLRLDDGEVIDQSDEGEPLEFIQGHRNIIPGLEKAIAGMKVGEKKEVVVEPEEGYGDYDEENQQTMPRSAFPPELELEEGLGLQLKDSSSGQTYQVYVADVGDKEVLLDFNHPLAGEKLFFTVHVADLRPATAEEISHGHAHTGEHHH